MSDVKWIKITTSMFDDEKIKLIESMPDKDSILIIWIKLLLQAGKTNAGGYVMLNENIPYTDEMLATIFNRPLNTVRLALETFEKFGMIEIDNRGIFISNWGKHQSIDKLNKIREQTRKRVQKHRAKKAGLLKNGDDISKVKEGKNCIYCGSEEELSIEHIIPVAKGGKSNEENCDWACIECNQRKNNRNLVDFLNDFIIFDEPINIQKILNNPKLNKYVNYNAKENKFYTCNVTSATSNGTEEEEELEEDKEIDKDKDKDKESNKKHSPAKQDNPAEKIPYKKIIDYLNTRIGSQYRSSTKKTQSLIKARWNEGFRLQDFKNVIDKKCVEWMGNEKMEKYLRPPTLFGTKFESYLNQLSVTNETIDELDQTTAELYQKYKEEENEKE